jgi:hypothetical protein
VGQESVNSINDSAKKAVSCSRKELEEAINLLISKFNPSRKVLIESLCSKGLHQEEKEKLLDLVHIGRKEHSVLKALFDKLDWGQKDLINQEKSQIFPSLLTIQEATNLSKSSVSDAKTRLQDIFLISWKNRYTQDRNGENKSTSNKYIITERVIRLAELTKISLKKELLREEKETLKDIISDFLLVRSTEKSGHQKSGLQGAKKKKFKETTQWLLNLALGELGRGPSSRRHQKCVRVLARVSVRMGGFSTESFQMSKSSIVKDWAPGLPVLVGDSSQKLDPGGPSSGPQGSEFWTPGVRVLDPNTPL